mgnify:CR=1 FL=1
MMNEDKKISLWISSRILSYPDDRFPALKSVFDELVEDVKSKDLQARLKESYLHLFQIPMQELRETYVATFDLKSSLGLYLTAHELGDSTKRGAALIKLQKIINQAGFEREREELADYIPMLLEFLIVAPETAEVQRLFRRLAVVFQRMKNHMEKTNPYAAILNALTEYVFPQPTKEEVSQLEYDREEADLEELPYPIMYQ